MEPLVYCNEGCGKTYARINRNTPHSNRYGASVAETTYNIIYTSVMYSRFSCFENFHILITESRKHFRQYVTAGSRQHCKYNDYPVKLCLFIIKIGTCPLPFGQKATIYSHRTGETSRTASRPSKTRRRHRCTLKPGQDFSRTSRQKTCPYGHKE